VIASDIMEVRVTLEIAAWILWVWLKSSLNLPIISKVFQKLPSLHEAF
jgi:hypothetical protein